MRQAIKLSVPLALLVACIAQAPAAEKPGELARRQAICDAASKAFLAADYDKLEATSTQYRKAKERLPSGVWKLSNFYCGIYQAVHQPRKDREARFAMLENAAKQWTQKYPHSPAAHITYGGILVSHGWAFRGSGYASTVRKEDWEPFFRYLARGRDYLQKHKAIAAADPQWYVSMLGIARAEGWKEERFEALLNEALEREPLFYQTYFEALENLLPKWSGSLLEIERFAQAAVRRTSAQEGRGMYARIYWYAAQTQYGNGLFMQSNVVWPSMKAGFDDVVARFPDPWNLNNYAKFACLARDRSTTREILRRVGGDVVPEAWQPEVLFKQCSEWVATAPAEPAVNTAWSSRAPIPVSPPPGIVFSHFPRSTDIEWQPVPGAASYSVEIDCMHCCVKDKWCADVGKTFRLVPRIAATTYHFEWVGANGGRWRVWAVAPDGRESAKTAWQEFTYTQ